MESKSNKDSVRQIFNDFASEYQLKYMNVQKYAEDLEVFCNQFDKDDQLSILDIGCGPGNLSKFISDKIENIKILGIDISDKMIDLARLNVPDAKFLILDSTKVLDLNQQFDGIVCGFCLPYMSEAEVVKLIEHSNEILNYEGILYLSFIIGHMAGGKLISNPQNESEPILMYYQRNFIANVLEQSNFILKYESLSETIKNDFEKDLEITLIAQKTNYDNE